MLTKYFCNITGQYFTLDNQALGREKSYKFGFTSRDRAVIYCLMQKLGINTLPLNSFSNKNIIGIGMSDNHYLSRILSQSFSYINTFFHQSPYLDIYNTQHISQYTDLDFIICSDVFEHISPYPGLHIAFQHLYRMLKKNTGVLIFSVPYNTTEHKEHFPSLYDYHIVAENTKYTLHNTTYNGRKEQFTNLCFHDGPGETLEMRQFSQDSIIQYLEKAGFKNITFHNITEDMKRFGIIWEYPTSLIVTGNVSNV